ncbi:protein involved in gliding motility GldA [Filimonas lacunae]|uniref:Protein involved in gliding motility GldA n=1 Tax=Filimonas lacunae TaxID=477680 RepID=A0A173MPD9_9BACT|nr:gliding motility-associated ABC transporter ATP-binding subunit GldA [Filimonas lacunae]BAV09300.1 ABC-type multidrug transport system, ATPase component [Filimonas lacunae]SIS70739.1 protein involved in gliding motility GldA [Filimonas lacunae]
MSIAVTQLTKLYGEQKAVNNISFTLGKGEIVGFLGPNGAGKSTTMKMITGYLQPDGGNVTVNGIVVKDNPINIKRKIGYLPESNALYTDMYIREYLAFVAGVHQVPDAKKRVEEVIALTGLTLESKKRIVQLSKGYKQRVGLAAALVHDPEVLILDEPTSGLDPNQIVEIRNVIKEQGIHKTVLFSSHILQEVQAICSRVIIINKGQLVADSPLADLQKGDNNAIKVSFEEALEDEWLRRLPAVNNVNKINTHTWQLQTSDNNAARKQLMELALKENLNITQLQNEGGNLEELFRSLTGDK